MNCRSAAARSTRADKDGVVGGLLGGWQVSTIYKYQSGAADVLPVRLLQRAWSVPRGMHPGDHRCGFRIRPGQGQLRSWEGAAIQHCAFEPASAFNYYTGKGNRVEESIRGFAYKNQDLTFLKNTRFGGGTNLQLRFEVFNMWNWHTFYGGSEGFGAHAGQHRRLEP